MDWFDATDELANVFPANNVPPEEVLNNPTFERDCVVVTKEAELAKLAVNCAVLLEMIDVETAARTSTSPPRAVAFEAGAPPVPRAMCVTLLPEPVSPANQLRRY